MNSYATVRLLTFRNRHQKELKWIVFRRDSMFLIRWIHIPCLEMWRLWTTSICSRSESINQIVCNFLRYRMCLARARCGVGVDTGGCG